MESVTKTVFLNQVVENKTRLRDVNIDNPSFQDLKRNIEINGLLSPITVQEAKTAEGVVVYELIDGLHRFTAVSQLAKVKPETFSKIPVNVVDAGDIVKTLQRQIAGNALSVETKPVEFSRALHVIMNANPNKTMNEISKMIGMSSEWLSKILTLKKLAPKVAALVDEGKVSLVKAFSLSKLEEDDQISFMPEALKEGNIESFCSSINEFKKAKLAALRTGSGEVVMVFKPSPKFRTLKDLSAEVEKRAATAAVVKAAAPKTMEDAFILGVKFAIQMDPSTLATKEKEFKEKQEKMNQLKKEKEETRKAEQLRKQEEKKKEIDNTIAALKSGVVVKK